MAERPPLSIGDGRLLLPAESWSIEPIRAQGAGGQHVNRTESAVQLRFDIAAAPLPEDVRERLLARADARRTRDGVLVIKAQRHRSQDRNRADALERLAALIEAALDAPVARRATRPSRAAKRRRTDDKTRRGAVKALRRTPGD